MFDQKPLRLGMRMIAFLILVAVGIGGLLAPTMTTGDSKPVYHLQDEPGWQIHLGDLPLAPDGSVLEGPASWAPLKSVQPLYSGKRYTGIIWLKRQLPGKIDPASALHVAGLKSYEMYLDNRRLASVNFQPYDFKVNGAFQWRLLPLPSDAGGHTVYARINHDDRGLLTGRVTIGGESGYWDRILMRDMYNIVLGTLFVTLGVASLILFLFQRTEKLHFHFSLFALSAGYGCIARTELAQVFVGNSVWIYLHNVAFPLATFAFLSFLETMYGSGVWDLRRRMRQTMLAFTGLCLAAAFWDDVLYTDLIKFAFPPLFFVVFALTAVMTVRVFIRSRDRETRSILVGFAVLLTVTLFHALLIFNQRWFFIVYERYPALYRIWTDQIFIGVFVFMLCLGMVLFHRFRQVHRNMKRYAAELELKNERLVELDKLKDAFLANMSHELRTPLHGILGLTQSLLDGVAGPVNAAARDNLELIVSSGKRLAGLIGDILDFSKLKHRDLALQLEPIDLGETVRLVLAVFAPLADKKKLRLIRQLDEALPPVKADGNRLEQILYNLIGNAIKFTESGEIRVEASRQDGFVRLSVSDTGIGVPESKHEAIFQVFEQGESSASREYGGTGLGLSITRKLVELHGGSIGLDSAPGRGSTFTFTLPVWEEDAAARNRTVSDAVAPGAGAAGSLLAAAHTPLTSLAAAEESESQQSREVSPAQRIKPTILIVDDEPVNLQVLGNYLAKQPYELRHAGSGAEALRLVAEAKPDLILLDVMMPRMTGYEVCREIRRTYSPGELPVLLVTAKNQMEDLLEGFNAGANDYLTKPVSRPELLARVELQLQLLQLNHSLERLVEERTADLADTNRRLHRSMRETAEAMAELSVLEERNRIAQDIHDIVGHTLSTTIVQIEAAKRLIERNDALGLEKLSVSQELVRKSLNEIRTSVRMLSESAADYDLAEALKKLLADTQEVTGIPVVFELDPLPPLSALQKKVLYHALQEGLTNGIKHGDCRRFDFTLRREEHQLRFILSNDGRAYENTPMGFGLAAMKERVQQLGGTMSLSAPETGGCLLRIVLPVE